MVTNPEDERLKWAVQALALPAASQLQLFPDFVCKADELALDLDQHLRAAKTTSWTPAQLSGMRALDAKLDAMSRGGPDYAEALWQDDALLRSPQWDQVRQLAEVVLHAFAWPPESPPEDWACRGQHYVPGSVAAGDAHRPTDSSRPVRFQARWLFVNVVVFQVLALAVLIFGDIGFDRPGRYGLDYGHFLFLAVVWGVASIMGVVFACKMRRPGLVFAQLLAIVVALAWGSTQ